MRQRGTVAVIVGLTLAVLIGFAGIALDLGHLYVTKTELQDAADACALAASRELTCDTSLGACASSFLENAENAGIMVASRNKAGFQGSAVTIAPSDVRFSTTFTPNSGYLSRADGADPASKYVMCIARRTGIGTWFMQVLGFGPQAVSAFAVATLANSQTACAMPIGLCKLPSGTPSDPFAGMVVGQWLTSKLTQSATGSFDWIDFTVPGGGASELADIIKGTGSCGLPATGQQVGEQGNITSLGKAWNTRFGLYKGGDTITTAPPDYTGYSYTPFNWPEKFNAYDGTSASGTPNYKTERASHAPYQGNALSGLNINNSYQNSTSSQLATHGSSRRLTTVPIVDCSSWAASNPQTVPVLGYACVLLLHPMTNDNGPSGSDEVWLEYRGKSDDPNSPCATLGGVGGPGSVGPLVPALVQ
ncbi:MAG: pilus assembly protein TadG-related protein [Rhodospirillaceae bacterium]